MNQNQPVSHPNLSLTLLKSQWLTAKQGHYRASCGIDRRSWVSRILVQKIVKLPYSNFQESCCLQQSLVSGKRISTAIRWTVFNTLVVLILPGLTPTRSHAYENSFFDSGFQVVHFIADNSEGESPVESPRRRFQNRESSSNDFSVYRLNQGDTIFVHVSPRSDQLSFQGEVDVEGNIRVPLLGIVPVRNLSLAEIEETLQLRFRNYIVNPQIRATLISQRSTGVTVIGEVVRPGFYRLSQPDLSLALAEAGGASGQADLRSITILRRQQNGEVISQVFDIYSSLEEGTQLSLPRLIDGDVIRISALDLEDPTLDSYSSSLVATSNFSRSEITVRVLDYTGQITRISVPNGSDFLDALTQISPNPRDANLSNVAVVRFDPIKQEPIARSINARSALDGNLTENPTLEHNDIIVIGRTAIARLNYTLGLITQPFRDVLSFVLFFDSFGAGANRVFNSR